MHPTPHAKSLAHNRRIHPYPAKLPGDLRPDHAAISWNHAIESKHLQPFHFSSLRALRLPICAITGAPPRNLVVVRVE